MEAAANELVARASATLAGQQGGAPGARRLVRLAPALSAALLACALALVEQSRRAEAGEQDREEREWAARELDKRRDRLAGVIESARDALRAACEPGSPRGSGAQPVFDASDVDVLLEAAGEVAQVQKSDPLVTRALACCVEGIALELAWSTAQLRRGRQIRAGSGPSEAEPAAAESSMAAAALVRQLEQSKEVLRKADAWLVPRGALLRGTGLRAAVSAAESAVSLRKSEQAAKAFKLLERAASQLPYLFLSSLLSALSGAIMAVKVEYLNSITTLAFEQVASRAGAAVPRGAGAGAGSISRSVRALFSLELLGLLSGFVSEKIKAMGRREFINTLQTQLFRQLVSQDLAYFEQHDLHEVRQLIGNTGFVCQTLFDLPIDVIQNASSMVAGAMLLWAKSRRLSLLLLLLLPLRLAATEALTALSERVENSLQTPFVENLRDIWSILVNPVGVRTLRSFGRERVETAIFAQGLKARGAANDRSALLFQVFEILRTLVDKVVEIGLLSAGGQLAAAGQFPVADVGSFMASGQHAFERARVVYYKLAEVLGTNGTLDEAERMFDLLHAQPSIGIDEPPAAAMPTPQEEAQLDWSVEFRGVSFAYPSRPHVRVLSDVSLRAAMGERVGIVGESGCGKSTLISLITRLYDPQEGEVRVAGRALREFNPLWLRRRVAVVAQNQYLPFRSVKENLLYGLFTDPGSGESAQERESAEEQERRMREALRMARCEDLFFDKARFPHGWHQDIGKDGAALSGGERQRLCIARAILTRPRVLILDEGTSALDEELQYQVQEAIQELYERSGRKLTIFTIAHRLSNFRHVDRVLVLDKGRLAEQGTAQELAARDKGIFANFVSRAALDFGAPPSSQR